MAATSPAWALDVPSVLVGLGGFGAKVARRIRGERAQALRLGGGDDREADDLREVIAGADTAAAGGELDPPAIARAVLGAAREVLGHGRLVQARDRSESEGITRLHVLVFAHLGEPAIRDGLGATLAAIEGLLLGHLGPIFEAFRTGSARGAAIVPLLAMPHPPAHPAGAAIATCLRGLIAAVAETPAERRAIPQVFVIEDVAERSILSPEEQAQCLRNFASLLLYAGDLSLVSSLIHGAQVSEPLATFVCATAELPRARLAAYGAQRVALEALEAIRSAPRVDGALDELDALEDVEVAALSRADEAERDVAAILGRYAPDRSRDPPPRWWEEGRAILGRYGPDTGDRSLDAPIPPARPSPAWLEGRMRGIQETWRLLQRRRFDDLVARDRAAVETWRDQLLERLRTRIDRVLWRDPSPDAFRRAEVLVSQLQRAFGEELDRAIAARDASTPVRPPSFDDLREAHAAALDAARQKPEVALLGLWGALCLVGFVVFLAPALHLLGAALGVAEGSVAGLLLLGYPRVSAAVVGALVVGGFGGYHLARSQIAILRAFDGLWAALERTITGRTGSLHAYFASRLRLARNIARVEVLLAIEAALANDAERLVLIDKAARRAQAILGEAQRELGVRDAGGVDDLQGLLGRPGEALVESLVGGHGAAAIAGALDPSGRQARIGDVLAELGEHFGRGGRWREEIPFADVDRLRQAAAAHAAPIAAWDPFADAARAEATAADLAAFLRRQRRTLGPALNFTGHEIHDPTGIQQVIRGEAILPPASHERVREALIDASTPIASRAGVEVDRAYYLLVASGIHVDAVASLRVPGAPGERAAAEEAER